MFRSFLKNAFVYALGDVLLLAGGIVLLPLYTRCLSRPEFGSLELLERVAEVLAIALVLRGVPLGVIVFFRQAQSESERGRVVGAGVCVALAAAVIGLVFVMVLARPLGELLQLENGDLLTIVVLANLVDGVGVVIQAANQARTESGFYVLISLAQFLAKVLLCILFVAVLGWSIWGVVAASLVRSIAFALVLVHREVRLGMLWPNSATLKELLYFAFPFVPTGLCLFVLHSADRFFLVRYVDQGDIGVYGLGYRLATLVSMVSLTPLFRVWSAQMHDVAGMPKGPQVFARMATYLLGAYVFVGLGLCLFQHELITLVAGSAYTVAGSVVAPVVLSYGFFGAATLLDAAFYVRRQTRYKAWIALASTLLMLGLYATLIPAHGLIGAALATLGGFACHMILTWRMAQTVFPVPYEYRRLLAMLLIAVGLWLVSQELEIGLVRLPVKIACWMLWPVTVWFSGLVTRRERRQARLLVLRWWAQVRLASATFTKAGFWARM